MAVIPKDPDAPPVGPVESTAGAVEATAWQKEMREAFRSLDPLLRFLDLDPALAPESLAADPAFPLLTPRSFASRMAKGDWNNPLYGKSYLWPGKTPLPKGFARTR